MKTWIMAAIFLAIGSGAGAGVTWWEFHNVDNWFTSDGQPVTDEGIDPEALAKAPKAVVVNGEKHDFGVQERNTEASHTFIIKNEGLAPLELIKGETTCKCTLSDVSDTTLAPGEQLEVKLTWLTKLAGESFEQNAEIFTPNDPRRKLIRLRIAGRVIDAVAVTPSQVTFTNKSATQDETAQVKVLCMREGELALRQPELLNPSSAPFFDVSYRPLTPEELAQSKDAKLGYAVTITAKSGLPLGLINQTIKIPTNNETETLQVYVDGNVVGDIRLLAPGTGAFLANENRLRVNTVNREEGYALPMKVLVTGPHRENINLRIGNVDPENVLKATLGEVRKVSGGATHMYDLKVEIPKNSTPTNRSGSKGAPPGIIVIESDHPDTPELKLYVEFAIEG